VQELKVGHAVFELDEGINQHWRAAITPEDRVVVYLGNAVYNLVGEAAVVDFVLVDDTGAERSNLPRLARFLDNARHHGHPLDFLYVAVAFLGLEHDKRAVASVRQQAVTRCFGAGVIDLLEYKNINIYKTVRILNGADINGTIAGFGGSIGFASTDAPVPASL